MLVFKSVKPTKMKKDAFRLEFLTMLHKMEREIKKDFEKTTETWEHDVKFETMISLRGGPTLFVGTDDEIYNLVSRDSPAHDIPLQPKVDGFLVYQTEFTPKTTPGVIGSVQGGKRGRYTRRKQVHHPGHVGRKFDEVIAKKWEPKFKDAAENAMAIAAEKSGHGMK